jgi:hypothetical protein
LTLLAAPGCAPFEAVEDGCRALRFRDETLVEVPGSPEFNELPQLTVETFVQFENINGESQIVAHHDYGQSLGYVLLISGGGGVEFRYYANSQWNTVNGGPVEVGRWHHLAVIFDGTTLRLFFDGRLQNETGVPGMATAYDGPLRIGAASYEDAFYVQGRIDEVRLSRIPRYLTDFAVPSEPFPLDPDTVALWHFDEPEGQLVEDATGNHPGTLGRTEAVQVDDPERVDGTCIRDIAATIARSAGP